MILIIFHLCKICDRKNCEKLSQLISKMIKFVFVLLCYKNLKEYKISPSKIRHGEMEGLIMHQDMIVLITCHLISRPGD